MIRTFALVMAVIVGGVLMLVLGFVGAALALS
jgi:hypothetical protein